MRSTSTEDGIDVQIFIVDARGHVVVVVEDDGFAGVLEQLGIGGRGLDDRAVGREVTAQHGQAAAALNRLIHRCDDVVVVALAR